MIYYLFLPQTSLVHALQSKPDFDDSIGCHTGNKQTIIHTQKKHKKMRKNENLLLPSLQASDQRLSGVPEPQRLFERSKAKKTTI